MSKLNPSQRAFVEALFASGELIFAGGRKGYSANIVGDFHINDLANETRVDMGDGTNHIHVDWSVLKTVVVGEFHGEGMVEFRYDDGSSAFRFYRPAGPFDDAVIAKSDAFSVS